MKDKNKKLMLIVSILVLGIGLTFAYFVVGVNILGNGGSTKLATSDLIRVKYDAGTGKLATSGLNPGHSTSKGFKVTVTPTKTVQDVTYRIFLNITSNTFEVCGDSNYNSITNDCLKDEEELIYILKDGNGNEIARGDLTNGVTGEVELARETKKVATEIDYNYTIEIEFKDTNKDQNHNQNKIIQGEIKVEFAEPDTSDLNIMAVYVEKEDKPGKYDSVDEIPIGKGLDKSKSYCEVNGEKINGIEFNYNPTTGIAGINNFNLKGTKCYLYFNTNLSSMVLSKLNIANVKSNETLNFNVGATGSEIEQNNGIFIADDPMYGNDAKTYYWRGAATSNHLIFANKCWRIIRINGDGTLRLIYNGNVLSNDSNSDRCTGNGVSYKDSVVGNYIVYNSALSNDSASVGWTYVAGSQRPDATNEGEASNAKVQTDKWYEDYIGNNSIYDNYIAEGKFCNDRRTKNNEPWLVSTNQYYASYARLGENKNPTLDCDSKDVYVLKAGAITADEGVMAGGVYGAENKKYYLYNGYPFWTMTPVMFTEAYTYTGTVDLINADGSIYSSGTNTNNPYHIRPVINLKANTDFTWDKTKDAGTTNNPYIVQ